MKQPQKQQLTTAQQAVLHVIESACLSALVAFLVAIVQYLSTGNIALATLFTVAGSAFLASLSMIYKSVKSDPSLNQAAMDTAQEALARIEVLAPWLNDFLAKQQNANQPTVAVPVPPAMPQAVRPPTVPAQSYPTMSGGGGMPQQQQPIPFRGFPQQGGGPGGPGRAG